MSAIILPNGTSWTFTYEQYNNVLNGVSGTELKEITLPTGGTISYMWESRGWGGQNGGLWRAITSRTVDDGTGHPQEWTYTWTTWSFPQRVLRINDPVGNYSIHTINGLGGLVNPHNYTTFKEVQLQQYSSNGSLLQTVTTAYDGTTLPYLPLTIQKQLSIQSGNVVAQTQKTYGAQFSSYWYATACCNPKWLQPNAYFTGNPSTVIDSDYGTNGPGGTLRTTTTCYQAFQIGNQCNQFPNNSCANNYCNANLLNLQSSVAVSGPGNSAQTNYIYDDGGGVHGSLTRIQRLWLNGNYITTDSMTYTPMGMLQTKADALGNTKTYTYDSKGLFPTSINDVISYMTTQYNYDENTGVLNSETDPNGKQITYTYDEMNRITLASYPDGGSKQYTYGDRPWPSGIPNVTVTTAITGSQNKQETAWVDGLGRLIGTQLTDPEGADLWNVTYDAVGRKATVTNPFRTHSDPTYGITQFQYDALNRLTTQTQPDNSSIGYSYVGNTTTVTDEAGKARKSQMDGLGRLTQVLEDPGSSPHLNYETDYSYDCLSNLTSVVQSGSRNRTFVYDSLSRLTSATNPESGQVTYNYDNDGTLTSKVEHGRNITTTYAPDPLHRITSKTYSNGDPTVTYCYDGNQTACGAPSVSNGNGIGRRTGMGDASGNKAWWYDALGRVTETSQAVTGYATGNIYYDYNLDGSLAQVTYPSDDEIQYTYSSAGRITQASWVGILQGATLASNITHIAAGNVAGYTNGDGATVTRTYNSRLQPQDIKAVGSQGTLFWLTYNFNAGNGDNGNVAGITDNVQSASSQAFTYDSLNRLLTASFYGGSDQYGYDPWGNLTSKIVTSGSGEPWSMGADANNRVAAWDPGSYDGAGNLIAVPGLTGTSTFNAENQWTTFSGSHASFLYDGDGQRMRSSEVGLNPETTYYWNDESGNVLMDSDSNLHINNLYFYLGGERIAYGPELGDYGLYFYYADQLGNVRRITNASQSICFRSDYYPFGGNIPGTLTNTCPAQYRQFTGKDRDPVMGVDYFGARYYKSDMSRFFSPDWSADVEPVPYAKIDNPQSLNLYTYVQNNPLTMRDADGHDCDVCTSVMNFFSAAANAWASDNAFGAGRQEQTTTSGTVGAAVGDSVATVTGTLEVLGGGGETLVTAPASTTGVGAVLPAAGAAVTLHGAGTAITATASLFKAGGRFSSKTKQDARAARNGKCAKCGVDTVPAQQSQKGVTPPGNEGQTDHIVPASKGGTNDPSNAEHLCRDCNIKKSDSMPDAGGQGSQQ